MSARSLELNIETHYKHTLTKGNRHAVLARGISHRSVARAVALSPSLCIHPCDAIGATIRGAASLVPGGRIWNLVHYRRGLTKECARCIRFHSIAQNAWQQSHLAPRFAIAPHCDLIVSAAIHIIEELLRHDGFGLFTKKSEFRNEGLHFILHVFLARCLTEIALNRFTFEDKTFKKPQCAKTTCKEQNVTCSVIETRRVLTTKMQVSRHTDLLKTAQT